MNKTLRTIIFLGFVLLFFTVAPLAVLYTAGYRYDSQYGLVSKTGVLSVTTTPRGASVSLDDEMYSTTTPKIIKRLVPGTYEVEIEKPGFYTWINDIKITGGLTSYIEDIVLFRKSTPQFLVEQEIVTTAVNEDATLAAYITEGENEHTLWLYRTDDGKHESITKIPHSEKHAQLSWSQSGDYLLVAADQIRVFKSSGDEIDISSSYVEDFQEVYWHPSEDKLLVVITNTNIVHFDVVKNSALIIESAKNSTISVDASLLSFIDNGSRVELRQTIGTEQKLIAILDKGEYQIVFRDGSYIIARDNLGYIHLIDIDSSNPILLEAKADLFDWNSESTELLYSNGYEMNIYSPGRHQTEFIVRQSDQITDLAWHPTGDAILFTTKNCLCAIDRNLFGPTRQRTTLIEGGSFNDFWISKNGKQAFVFGSFQGNTGLFQLQLR